MSLPHDFSESLLVVPGFAAGAMANSTQNGSSVDTQALSGGPYRRAALLLDLNPGAATTANVQIQESADNSTWSNVTGATLGSAVSASTQYTSVINVDLAPRKRYLRVNLIGTGTAGAASLVWVFFNGEVAAPAYTNAALFV